MTDTLASARPRSGTKEPSVSAVELLKQAVSGSANPGSIKASAEAPSSARPGRSFRRKFLGVVDARAAVVGGAALGLGLVIGAGGAALLVPRGDIAAATLTQLKADVDAGRAETARIAGEIGRLAGTIAKSGERAAEDAKTTRTDLTQRVTRMEQTLATKIVALTEKQDSADREHSARLSSLGALIEKRAAVQAVATPAPIPQAARPATPEPVQTGSIVETKASADVKPKPATVSTWAVREVYDGIAVLEDRKRRLIEVARGDAIPGIGRAEAIERRGRNWVVVTKDGLITPQDW